MDKPDAGHQARRKRRLAYLLICLVSGATLLLGFLAFAARDKLLLWYYEARLTNGGPPHWIVKMIEVGPEGAKRVIQETKTGSYDGDIEQIVGGALRRARYDVYPYVYPLFQDSDPAVRGYAASVAGWLGDRRYLSSLERLAQDDTPLPKGWFSLTVANRAKGGIEWIEKGPPASPMDDPE